MGLPIVPIAVKLLLGLGPTLLRKLGASKGGTAASVADTVAEVIENVSGKPESEQQAAVEQTLRGLTPEQAHAYLELQVDLERIKQEGVWKKLEHAVKLAESDNAARIAELHQTDLYTKQTRPRIARQSWYVAGAYALLSNVAIPLYWQIKGGPTFDGLVLFSWEVFIALAAPAMVYMGVRGFEKWRGGGVKV